MRNIVRLARTAIVSLGFVISVTSASGQRDVHAALISKSNRKPAPDFHLVAADGRTMQVSSYQGRVVLLNFWATSCGGCVLEIPSFIELQHAYATSGFTAVGISADIPYEGLKGSDEAWKLVRPFIVSHNLNYPILMGDASVVDSYGFKAYPATFLIDKAGNIAATYEGIVSKANVEANVKMLLAER
jgi:peroxiredoxin